jgi:peptide/nickel transport system permease protein
MAANPLGAGATAVLPARRAQPGAWTTLVRFCRKKPLGAAGGVIMLVILLTAVFADQLQTYDPIATDAAQSLAPPSWEHWLGSDHLGRDIYSRIVHGARVSLMVGVASTLMGSVLGGIIGLLSAYVGGKTDLITQRFMDILQGLPLLVLALVMSAALGPSSATSFSPSRFPSFRAPRGSSGRAS